MSRCFLWQQTPHIWQLVLVELLFTHSFVCAQDIDWLSDCDAAAQQANENGRLLMVVHLSGDFTTNDISAREFKVFSGISLSDAGVKDLIASKFVCAYRYVGQPECIATTLPQRGRPKVAPNETVAVYIVAPVGKVVHFLPGLMACDEFLKQLEWSIKLHEEVSKLEYSQRPLAIRNAHLKRVLPDHLALFRKINGGTLWSDEQSPSFSQSRLQKTISAAKQTRDTRIAARLGGKLTGAQMSSFVAAAASHGELETSLAHLVLSEFPLIAFDELQVPAWTAFAQQRYWRASPRREEVKQWLTERINEAKPILLVVTPDTDEAENIPGIKITPAAWPPKSQAVLDLLPGVEVRELTIDELAQAIVDCQLQSLTMKAAERPRFVVLRPDGKRQAVYTHVDGVSKLAQGLKAALAVSEPAALLNSKGSDDETN